MIFPFNFVISILFLLLFIYLHPLVLMIRTVADELLCKMGGKDYRIYCSDYIKYHRDAEMELLKEQLHKCEQSQSIN